MNDFNDFLAQLNPNEIIFDAANMLSDKNDRVMDHSELLKTANQIALGFITAYLRAYHNWLAEQI